MKNLKTSLAAFLSVGVSYLLKLEFPFFTAISTIFTIESSKETPLKAGASRMLGSLVGAAIGVGLASIKPGNVVLCGLGMMVIIYICNILKWDKAIPIAGVIFMAIMLGKDIRNPLQYSINRILNTFAGIVVAVAVDYAIPSARRGREPA
ncbi:MAG TPA: aromatic acid exporter family protein [Clostridia bacterium]|nr:aromatic acid exporter family protein [Clostridia bacterium]